MITNPLVLAMQKAGLKLPELAWGAQIAEQTLRRKCAGGTKFTDTEMLSIGRVLRLNNDEFVDLWVRFAQWRDFK